MNNPILQLTCQDISSMLKPRNPDTYKGDFGRILLICGSVGYSGAPALAAMGALRSGAGLVHLAVPDVIYNIEAEKLLEPVIHPFSSQNGMFAASAIDQICNLTHKMDAVLIGCGLGRSEECDQLVYHVLKKCKAPVILDADGINAATMNIDILRERTFPTIITPHYGEYKRLVSEVSGDRCTDAVSLAQKIGCVVLLKGHNTVISDGTTTYMNSTGNPGMATGGSGDVLAGIITSLVGQGLSPLTAAACGAWLHGAAGDICADEIGQYGMLPQDIIKVLPRLLP